MAAALLAAASAARTGSLGTGGRPSPRAPGTERVQKPPGRAVLISRRWTDRPRRGSGGERRREAVVRSLAATAGHDAWHPALKACFFDELPEAPPAVSLEFLRIAAALHVEPDRHHRATGEAPQSLISSQRSDGTIPSPLIKSPAEKRGWKGQFTPGRSMKKIPRQDPRSDCLTPVSRPGVKNPLVYVLRM